MSKYFIQPIITDIAMQEMATAIGSKRPITFTRVVLGTGRHTGNLTKLTNIKTPSLTLPAIQSLTAPKSAFHVIGRLDNSMIESEITVTEIGLFAKVGDRPEFLYMYTSAESGDTIPPKHQAVLIRDYEFDVHISTAGQVTVQYVQTDTTNVLARRHELDLIAEDVKGLKATSKQDMDRLKASDTALEMSLNTHILNSENPHEVTKAQVGLGNVDNVKQASKDEFDGHVGNTTVHVTAQDRSNWNSKANGGDLTSHTGNRNNPHGVTKAQIGLGNVNNVAQAPKTEFDTHNSDNTRHITTQERANWNSKANGSHSHPTSQINGLDTKLSGYDGHVGSKSNPHGVTKTQIGLGNVSNVLQAPKTDFDALKGRYDREVSKLQRESVNNGSAARYECPRGTDLANWLKGSTVPSGLFVIRDLNSNRYLRVVKQDTNNIYCDSILGDGHYIFVIHNGQSTGWQQDGPVTGENSNGRWTKFPDGTLICWGLPRIDYGGAVYSGIKTITFPVAFTSNPGISVNIHLEPASESYKRLPGVNITSQTLRNFSFTVGDNAGGRSGSYMFVYYIAIGRWK